MMKFMLLVLLTTVSLTNQAQINIGNSPDAFVNRPVATSPEAAAIASYEQEPRGMYNGCLTKSIDLYTLTAGPLKVPLALNYSGCGNKVGQDASYVGLGWSLDGIYQVSRTIHGLADEIPLKGWLYMASQMDLADFFPAGSDNWTWYRDIFKQCMDGEPDEIIITGPGFSATCRYDFDGNLLCASEQKLKVTAIGMPPIGQSLPYEDWIDGWEVVDARGVKYIFDAVEISKRELVNASLNGCYDYSMSEIPTTWKITRMQSAISEDWIEFDYETNYPRSEGVMGQSLTHAFYTGTSLSSSVSRSDYRNEVKVIESIRSSSGARIDFFDGVLRSDMGNSHGDCYDCFTLGSLQVKNAANDLIKEYGFEYDNITGRNTLRKLNLVFGSKELGSYEFDYEGMLPPTTSFRRDHYGFLNNNNVQSLIPPIKYKTNSPHLVNGSYYIDWNPQLGDDYVGIPVLSGDGLIALQGADRSPSVTGSIAALMTKFKTPFGAVEEYKYGIHDYSYINGGPIRKHVYNQFIVEDDVTPVWNDPEGRVVQKTDFTITSPAQVTVTYRVVGNGSDFGFPDEEVGFEIWRENATTPILRIRTGITETLENLTGVLLNGLLDPGDYYLEVYGGKIRDLTGDGTTFIFNSAWAKLEVYQGTNTTERAEKIGGGARIEEVKRYDNISDVTPEVITFNYDQEEGGEMISSGVGAYHEYPYAYFFANVPLGSTPSPNHYELRRFANSVVHIDQSKGYVGYQKVTVFLGSEIDKEAMGKTEYFFTSRRNFPDTDFSFTLPFAPADNRAYKLGLLTKEVISKKNSSTPGDFEVVKTTDYSIASKEKVVVGIKAGAHANLNDGDGEATYTDESLIDSYTIRLGVATTFPNKIETKDMEDSDLAYVELFEREYDDYFNLKKTVNFDSEGNEVVTRYRYPYEMDPSDAIISTMMDRNFLPMVEKIVWKRTATNEKIMLGAMKTTFKISGSRILVDKVYAADFPTELTSTDSLTIAESYYRVRLWNREYDDHGRILETTQSDGEDIHSSYIWSQDKEYPIAAIENARHNEVYYNGFEEPGQGTLGGAKSGKYKLSGVGAFGIPSNFPDGSYVLSYWMEEDGDWKYITKEYPNYQRGDDVRTDALNGNSIDEVRFHPIHARMISFSFKPQVGLITMTDPNGKSTSFEYDDFNRLVKTRDNWGQLISLIKYFIQGQNF